MNSTNTLGNRLRTIREQLGLTQVEMGEALHLSHHVISKYECDIARPSLETLIVYTKKGHCSLDYLILGTERDLPKPLSHALSALSESEKESIYKIAITCAEQIKILKSKNFL